MMRHRDDRVAKVSLPFAHTQTHSRIHTCTADSLLVRIDLFRYIFSFAAIADTATASAAAAVVTGAVRSRVRY